MPEHHRDKAKIIHFFCDLRKKSSEGLSDDFTWGELGRSGGGVSGWVGHIKTQWERGNGCEGV